MAKSIAEAIRKLREDRKFSQEEISHKLGVSRPTYVQIEKGERELSVSEAQKLAAIFQTTLDLLLSGSDKSPYNVTLEKSENTKEKKQEIRINVPQENVEKFKEVLLYILQKVGARPNVGETVLYKLLYFIDFDYYEKYEEQLIGATYIRNHFGPTPVEFASIIEDMKKSEEIQKIDQKYHGYSQKKYLPLREPNLGILSANEITLVDDVINKLAHKSATELSEYSHNDVPWKDTPEGAHIDYEAVFYRTPAYSVRTYDDKPEDNS